MNKLLLKKVLAAIISAIGVRDVLAGCGLLLVVAGLWARFSWPVAAIAAGAILLYAGLWHLAVIARIIK